MSTTLTIVRCKNAGCHKTLLRPDTRDGGYVILCSIIVIKDEKVVGRCKKCNTDTNLPLAISLASSMIG